MTTLTTAQAQARDLHTSLTALQQQAIAEKRHGTAYQLVDMLVSADDIVAVLDFMARAEPSYSPLKRDEMLAMMPPDRTALLPQEPDL